MLCIPSNIMNSLFFPYDICANLVGFLTLVPVIAVYTCSDTNQKRHIHANLVKIWQPVHEICRQAFFVVVLNSAV